MFLIGAYAKYNWPYVWVRSHGTEEGVQNAAPLPSARAACMHAVRAAPRQVDPAHCLLCALSQLRSRPHGKKVEDIDAPLDLPSTKDWKTKGEAAVQANQCALALCCAAERGRRGHACTCGNSRGRDALAQGCGCGTSSRSWST